MSLRRHIQTIAYRLLAPGKLIRFKYEAFKRLLEYDNLSHNLIARLEKSYHEGTNIDFCAVEKTYGDLYCAISKMIESLNAMAGPSCRKLQAILDRVDTAARLEFTAGLIDSSSPFSFTLDEVPPESERLVGGKAACLSGIIRSLMLTVPGGFAVTSSAFNYFLDYHGLRAKVDLILAELDVDLNSSLEFASRQLKSLILNAPLPPAVASAIAEGCARIARDRDALSETVFAVRSSAVGEDAALSFAGQYRTLLNVSPSELTDAYKEVIASKYSPTALYYRVKNGLLDTETPMAVLFVEMVSAEASGIVYSRNPTSSHSDRIMIYSVWGLGELLVKGAVAPDVIELSKDGCKVIGKVHSPKEVKAVLSAAKGIETVALKAHEKERISLDDSDARQLALWALELEAFFGSPQDVEWCKDHNGKLYILQSRPLRVEDSTRYTPKEETRRIESPILLTGGEKAASGVASGTVATVLQHSDIDQVPEGAVLVAPNASLSFARVIGRLRAVVTDEGSVAGHFVSIAREWGVPTLVNTAIATRVLSSGEIVTVDADRQMVFAGDLGGARIGQSKGRSLKDSPFKERLRRILDLTSPLNLIEPRDPSFRAENCKTIHDILRFIHEKAVEEMFSLGGKTAGRLWGAKKLTSNIPIALYVLDLEGGLSRSSAPKKRICVEDITNLPLKALWKGLSHPSIEWSSRMQPVDLGEIGRVTAGEGIISLKSGLLASFAIVSADYLNINIRFGYHFVVIDALCGTKERENYITLRFEGGGGAFEGRYLRVLFLADILKTRGFEVHLERDIIHAQLRSASPAASEEKLELVGRLLAFTPLLDMRLNDVEQVQGLAEEFLGI